MNEVDSGGGEGRMQRSKAGRGRSARAGSRMDGSRMDGSRYVDVLVDPGAAGDRLPAGRAVPYAYSAALHRVLNTHPRTQTHYASHSQIHYFAVLLLCCLLLCFTLGFTIYYFAASTLAFAY